MAFLPTFDARVKDMREGSSFLARLNDLPPEYPIFAYARLNDGIVNEANAGAGEAPAWWVVPPIGLSHVMAGYDRRILADIARRLRGEEPFTTAPPAPLPD